MYEQELNKLLADGKLKTVVNVEAHLASKLLHSFERFRLMDIGDDLIDNATPPAQMADNELSVSLWQVAARIHDCKAGNDMEELPCLEEQLNQLIREYLTRHV